MEGVYVGGGGIAVYVLWRTCGGDDEVCDGLMTILRKSRKPRFTSAKNSEVVCAHT
jgi:hypothetical protein